MGEDKQSAGTCVDQVASNASKQSPAVADAMNDSPAPDDDRTQNSSLKTADAAGNGTENESETALNCKYSNGNNGYGLHDDDDKDDRTEEERSQQRLKALEWLRKAVNNPEADFHEGQWEAIDAVANRHQRVVVVQRTGWGKSSVYFIATRLLREEQKRGPTLIISPLLALMRNQVDAAGKLGIRSATLNSSNPKEWETITADILSDKVILNLFISKIDIKLTINRL